MIRSTEIREELEDLEKWFKKYIIIFILFLSSRLFCLDTLTRLEDPLTQPSRLPECIFLPFALKSELALGAYIASNLDPNINNCIYGIIINNNNNIVVVVHVYVIVTLLLKN